MADGEQDSGFKSMEQASDDVNHNVLVVPAFPDQINAWIPNHPQHPLYPGYFIRNNGPAPDNDFYHNNNAVHYREAPVVEIDVGAPVAPEAPAHNGSSLELPRLDLLMEENEAVENDATLAKDRDVPPAFQAASVCGVQYGDFPNALNQVTHEEPHQLSIFDHESSETPETVPDSRRCRWRRPTDSKPVTIPESVAEYEDEDRDSDPESPSYYGAAAPSISSPLAANDFFREETIKPRRSVLGASSKIPEMVQLITENVPEIAHEPAAELIDTTENSSLGFAEGNECSIYQETDPSETPYRSMSSRPRVTTAADSGFQMSEPTRSKSRNDSGLVNRWIRVYREDKAKSMVLKCDQGLTIEKIASHVLAGDFFKTEPGQSGLRSRPYVIVWDLESRKEFSSGDRIMDDVIVRREYAVKD